MQYIPGRGTATALKDLNLRKGQPSTRADVVGRLLLGATVDFIGWVTDGEVVASNAKWFKTADGNYLWSGNVASVLYRATSAFPLITAQHLTSLVAAVPDPDILVGHLNRAMEAFAINTRTRQCMFLAQLACESKFKIATEDLLYSAERLVAVWPKRFTAATAPSYARNPEKLANFIYANGNGNGNESSGDGWRFRGRGYIQLTGRGNYAKYGRLIGVDLIAQPDVAATPEIASRVAGAYWEDRGLNELADKNDFREITRRINGGYLGLPERLAFLAKAQRLLD